MSIFFFVGTSREMLIKILFAYQLLSTFGIFVSVCALLIVARKLDKIDTSCAKVNKRVSDSHVV